MMCDQDLLASLWAEAASTAVYIQNRCHHAILDQKTPEEVFTVEKPDVGHLRIFGCPVYVHVPKEKRTKMEPLRKKGIFVVIVRHQNSIIYMFLVRDRSRLDEMSLLMRMQPS